MIIVVGVDDSGKYVTGWKSKGLYDDETKQINVSLLPKAIRFIASELSF